MKIINIIFLNLLFIVLITKISYSTGYYISNKTPYWKIQDGIDAATNGDTVFVDDGTYIGLGNKNLDFKGKAIIVKSINGPDSTIIDCESDGRGFYFHSGEGHDSKVENISIRKGNKIGFGLGFYCENSSPTISGCKINNNGSPSSNVSTLYFNNSESIITNCEISYNIGRAGAIYLINSNLQIMKCTIMRNDATWGGGGINAENSIFVINDCVIDSNQSGYGGGIYSKNCTISLFVCEITNNLATAWDYSEGGGIYCGRDSYIDIQDCIISSNESWYIGGGISCHYLSDMVITNSIISDNVAQAWELISYGGGICGSPTMTNCIISGNEAQDGGGIGGSPTMTNCVIFKNRAPWGKGGGICGAYGSKNLTLTNCTVTENLAVDGGAIYFYGSPQAQIVNSIIWDNRYDELYVDSLYANPIITYSDIKGGWQGESNINLDPLFVDPESLNFHLQALSPCIDAGDPFYEVPVGGGRRIDMGAYEYWLGWNVKDLNSYRHYFKDNNEFLLNFTEKLQKKFK